MMRFLAAKEYLCKRNLEHGDHIKIIKLQILLTYLYTLYRYLSIYIHKAVLSSLFKITFYTQSTLTWKYKGWLMRFLENNIFIIEALEHNDHIKITKLQVLLKRSHTNTCQDFELMESKQCTRMHHVKSSHPHVQWQRDFPWSLTFIQYP